MKRGELSRVMAILETIDSRLKPVAVNSPKLSEYAPVWLKRHSRAAGLKPRSIDSNDRILDFHIIPALGKKRLHEIDAKMIATFKERINDESKRGPKTCNNILSVLSMMLKCAEEWGVLDEAAPVKQIKAPKPDAEWYNEKQLIELLAGAQRIRWPHAHLSILLGGDAGLRTGEILALRWDKIDFERSILRIVKQISKGVEGPPKNGKPRNVPMTKRLLRALRRLRRQARGALVVEMESGRATSEQTMRRWIYKAQDFAGITYKGPHILRHTFCSRLAARGASPWAIQVLAGHQSQRMVERYVHLHPKNEGRTAIKLLNKPTRRYA